MSSPVMTDIHKDVRLIERGLAKGFLSRGAAEKLYKDLPDVADKGEWIEVDDQDAQAAEPAED